MAGATPTVFVVDDDDDVRSVISSLLRSEGLHAATFATAKEFLASFDPSAPGCLLLDIHMPGMSGLDLQAELRSQNVCTPVIIITGQGDVPMAVRAVKTGALDFIEKPFSSKALVELVRSALELDAEQRRSRSAGASAAARVATLTPREREVFCLLAEGFALKQVALKLGRSYKTADKHRANLMKKLDIHDRVELTHLAIRARLVTL